MIEMTSEGVMCLRIALILPHSNRRCASSVAQVGAPNLAAVRFRQFCDEIDDSWVLVGRGLLFRVLLQFRYEFV
jgi:hypothetical protein